MTVNLINNARSFFLSQRMEEKQAELDNPVEGWNLSVKDVRKILSRKHRHRRSDDVIREGDYPGDDDTDEEEQEVGGAKGRGSVARGGEQPTKEPIAEFPISSSRRTRSSTSSSRDRRQPEHHHHREHHHHHHHKEHHSSSSTSSSSAISGVSPVISVSPVMLAAAAASVDPSSRANASAHPATGKKAPPTGTGTPIIPASAQKPATPIAQPSALPPPHLKTPVTMVISRDPRVAKRQQQQLLEKTQQGSSTNQQQAETNEGSKSGPDSKSPSPRTETSPQKSAESDEARMRERILLRQKYRIRKASDRRDSKDDSPEDVIVQQSPTAPIGGSLSQPSATPPPSSVPASSAPAPIKSCLVVKGASSSTDATTSSNVKTISPIAEPNAHGQSSSQQQDQGVLARPPTCTSNEHGASLHPPSSQQPPPPRQQGFGMSGSAVGGESVEQCTGELELSPHKKAVFVLDAKSAPVDVTSLTPVHGGSGEASGRGTTSTTHEVLSDSRVEPETGEVESMSVSTTQVPSQASVGMGSSEVEADTEATPTASVEGQIRNEDQPESDEDEKDDSSDSTDDEDRDEREGGAKQEGGVAVGKCYMDREGEEEMGVASDKETKEDER